MNTITRSPPHIKSLKVENFRALRNVHIKGIEPLTVLIGPNGSGKSTVFDVFAFLAECFQNGLRTAWDKRGRAKELKSRGARGPISIEIQYREERGTRGYPLITYHLEVNEEKGRPIVLNEWLQWKRGSHGRPFRFMEYVRGRGRVVSGDFPEENDIRRDLPLKSPDTLAVNALGHLAENPRVVALRDFITGWHVSYMSVDNARRQPEIGPQDRLDRTGSNLANVIQYLSEQHPDRLKNIFEKLRARVPRIDKVDADAMPDGRLLLRVKDAPFKEPVLARFVSDGTLKMLAYLVLLHDPQPPPFIGIEEPENFLHPRLLHKLAEECLAATESTQLLVTTHSPFFLGALEPKNVRVLWRGKNGYTSTQCLGDNKNLTAFVDEGGVLGDLWMEGYFGVGDPLTDSGLPIKQQRGR